MPIAVQLIQILITHQAVDILKAMRHLNFLLAPVEEVLDQLRLLLEAALHCISLQLILVGMTTRVSSRDWSRLISDLFIKLLTTVCRLMVVIASSGPKQHLIIEVHQDHWREVLHHNKVNIKLIAEDTGLLIKAQETTAEVNLLTRTVVNCGSFFYCNYMFYFCFLVYVTNVRWSIFKKNKE